MPTDYQAPAPLAAPRRIGGLLVLPLLGLVVTLGLVAWNLVSLLGDTETFGALFRSANPRVEPLKVAAALSLGADVALFAFTAVVLTRFLKRSRMLPSLMIIYYLALIADALVEYLAASALSRATDDPSYATGPVRDVVRALISAAIWVPYFVRSKRVRNTFVE